MRIIAFANQNSGPGYHRVYLPLMNMDGPDVFVTNCLLPEHFEGRDIFFYNRMLFERGEECGPENLLKLKEKHGFRIVLDIDDWWILDKRHILYETYESTDWVAKEISHIRAADAILTTHERLADAICDVLPAHEAGKVHICPNSIPRIDQFNITRTPSDMVRLFWQGSATHLEDIQLLERPIEALGPIAKKVRMVMAGFHKDYEEWHVMANMFTAGLKTQYKLIDGAEAKDYYAAYAEADICLVPLVNSPFNRMKSNLKILEAANLGLPVIASGVHPYLDMPVSYCKSSRDWIGHIKRLVQWPERRREEGQRLAEYCREHYDFNKINNERRQILEHVATKAGV